jgi:hypothetical protein
VRTGPASADTAHLTLREHPFFRTARPIARPAISWIAAAGLAAFVLVGCRTNTADLPSPRACGPGSSVAAYRTKGKALVGDVDADGSVDRVTLRADTRRAPRCRHLLVVEIHKGTTLVAPVKPLPWPGGNPRLLALAEIDGHAGLEPVVELSPANVYRPGAVFTLRDGRLTRMRLEVKAPLPDDLFPFSDEFPAGVDCTGRPGTIVATWGGLAENGGDDSHWKIVRSFYRAVGNRFERVRFERFRVAVGPEAKRRWPELRGVPFRSCPNRVD